MDKVPMTADGYKDLQEELHILKSQERPNVIKAIAEAREHGDLSENAEYSAARERQSFIEGRIADIENRIGRADVIDTSSLSGDRVMFGATTILADTDNEEEKTYRIVGEHESNISTGAISIGSPLARALIGKSCGDVVEVTTPGGTKTYEIISLSYQ
jgi:transcription elongation factor GreA